MEERVREVRKETNIHSGAERGGWRCRMERKNWKRRRNRLIGRGLQTGRTGNGIR